MKFSLVQAAYALHCYYTTFLRDIGGTSGNLKHLDLNIFAKFGIDVIARNVNFLVKFL